jgi:hypothetical protein
MRKAENPEIQRLVIAWIEQYGIYETVIPELFEHGFTISLSSISNALTPGNKYFLPDFHIRIQQAYKRYAETHVPPHEDPANRKTAAQKFTEGLEKSGSYVLKNTYDEQGRLDSRLVKKTGISQWQYDRCYPKAEISERAVMFVTANMLKKLALKGYDDTIKGQMMIFISECLEEYKQDLERKGANLKYLDEVTDET